MKQPGWIGYARAWNMTVLDNIAMPVCGGPDKEQVEADLEEWLQKEANVSKQPAYGFVVPAELFTVQPMEVPTKEE